MMLVDSVERLSERNPEQVPESILDVRDTINRVIDSKITEGQLDDVDFTLRDLSVIRETLLSALRTVYHTRKVKEIQEKESPQHTTEKQEDDVSEASVASR